MIKSNLLRFFEPVSKINTISLKDFNKYGSSKYWWMFAMRNKDTLIDPIQDFKAGITIKIPKIENLR